MELRKVEDRARESFSKTVAQICESVEEVVTMHQESQTRRGVRSTSFQKPALDTLTGVAVQYIRTIGMTAQFYANVAGRVEGNCLDIVQALEDLGSGSGVSDTGCCSLADSDVVKDKTHAPCFSDVGAEPLDDHIPVWLPAFPETNVDTIQGGAVSLPCIRHSLNGVRSDVLESPKGVRNSTRGEEEMEGNPFLTAPLRFVENGVSPVVIRPLDLSNEVVGINHIPDKHMSNNHHIPVLEASALSDDINRKNMFEDGEKKGGARPQQSLLRFKIGTPKRPSCLVTHRWFKEGEVKREKKSEIVENHQRIDSDVK
ncbi:hypothetical protein Bca4012_067108 [Brassica carinata]